MKDKQFFSVQEWLPFDKILENGIIRLKDSSYLKLLKIIPINFNLKSELEKEAILNSYKIFLKTCNFNFQILIQSNKEDLSKHISILKNQSQKETKSISNISEQYIKYIQSLNHNQKSSTKNFFIILKKTPQNNDKIETMYLEELNEQYFKVKECLARCGNSVIEILDIKEVQDILFSFFNSRIYLER